MINTDELTQLTAAQQTVLTRHDREMAEITAILNRVAQQQEGNAHQIEANSHQINLNREGIGELRASILELRNILSDYLQGRLQS